MLAVALGALAFHGPLHASGTMNSIMMADRVFTSADAKGGVAPENAKTAVL